MLNAVKHLSGPRGEALEEKMPELDVKGLSSGRTQRSCMMSPGLMRQVGNGIDAVLVRQEVWILILHATEVPLPILRISCEEQDGTRVKQHPIPDQMAADRYKATQTAHGRKSTGLRFFKIVPPGSV